MLLRKNHSNTHTCNYVTGPTYFVLSYLNDCLLSSSLIGNATVTSQKSVIAYASYNTLNEAYSNSCYAGSQCAILTTIPVTELVPKYNYKNYLCHRASAQIQL